MKKAKFDRTIREILLPRMGQLGFDYDRSTFYRQLASGVIHLMGLEFDPRTTDTFRVMCGLCTRMIDAYKNLHPHDMGYIGAQQLTKQGWYCNSGHWPCATEDEARASLAEVCRLIPSVVEPWFEKFMTLSSVAALMDTENPRQGLHKARVFLADGNRVDAVQTLKEFLESLAAPKPWDDLEELAGYREQAEALLRELG